MCDVMLNVYVIYSNEQFSSRYSVSVNCFLYFLFSPPRRLSFCHGLLVCRPWIRLFCSILLHLTLQNRTLMVNVMYCSIVKS